jgi:hypothetical protein
MRDSTQSFTDSPANNPLLRSDASSPAYLPRGTNPYGEQYGATHSRLLFTARNSRFGFQLKAPEFSGIRTTATIEVDFMGNQPKNPYTKEGEVNNPNTPTETAFFTNAAVRMRHANILMENRVVDVLIGQYYHLFGWQPHYFPGAVAFLGLPNMVFGRTPQFRLSKTIHTEPIDIQLAGAVLRPPQADSGLPDFQGGLRFSINPWTGAHGRGSGRAAIEAMSVGATGVYRRFRVAEYTNNLGDPLLATSVATAPGYGLSVDGRIPVIPASSLDDKGNSLVLLGSFVVGQGIGDLYTGGLHWGAPFPRPEGPQGPMTGFYGANIDPGLVMFDANGVMRVVKSRSWLVGFQYFLPIFNGDLVLAANHSRASSPNNRFTVAEGGDPARTFKEARYYDVNLFVDYAEPLRAGVSFQRIEQIFNAGMVEDPQNPGVDVLQMGDFMESNYRVTLSSYFFF